MIDDKKQLTPLESFNERVQAKLRDDVAGMLPDELLKAMVEKATQSLFFERKTERREKSWNNYETIELPSAFEKAVMEAVKPIIQAQVAAVVEARMPEIVAAVDKALDEGLMSLAVATLDKWFKTALQANTFNIEMNLKNEMNNRIR